MGVMASGVPEAFCAETEVRHGAGAEGEVAWQVNEAAGRAARTSAPAARVGVARSEARPEACEPLLLEVAVATWGPRSEEWRDDAEDAACPGPRDALGTSQSVSTSPIELALEPSPLLPSLLPLPLLWNEGLSAVSPTPTAWLAASPGPLGPQDPCTSMTMSMSKSWRSAPMRCCPSLLPCGCLVVAVPEVEVDSSLAACSWGLPRANVGASSIIINALGSRAAQPARGPRA
jgi:hypothetical protein